MIRESQGKENGQTVISDDLSVFAPLSDEMLKVWRDFRKVVEFIQQNEKWLRPLLERVQNKTEG